MLRSPGRLAVAACFSALTALRAFGSDVLTFESHSVSARVTRGASTAWVSMGYTQTPAGAHLASTTRIITDSDQDGTVRLQQSAPILESSIWGVVDMRARTMHVAAQDGRTVTRLAMAMNLLRDVDGDYSWIEPLGPTHGTWLWIRPGTGVWTTSIVYGLTSLTRMIPVGGSPRPPAGLQRGDLLAAVDLKNYTFFGGVVDALLEAVPTNTSVIAPSSGFASEKDGLARALLIRGGSTEGVSTVDYATVDESAVAGVHYLASAGTITFQPGEIFKHVPIRLIDDATHSGTTTVGLAFSNATGATLASNSLSSTIRDDDPLPSIAASDVTVLEGDAGTHEIPVRLELLGSTRLAASVRWRWFSATESGSGHVLFAPGEQEKTISVGYTANTAPEPDQKITLFLTEPHGATIAKNGTIWVTDDDSFGITPLDTTVNEADGTARVTVTLSRAFHETVSVSYDTRVINAKAPASLSDFVATSGTVRFEPGETRKEVAIQILQDLEVEAGEAFELTLHDPTPAAILRRRYSTVSITDDDVLPIVSISKVISHPERARIGWIQIDLARGVSTKPVSVKLQTTAGTAHSGRDFEALSEIVTIESYGSHGFATVWVFDDAIREGDESFTVTISAPKNAILGNSIATFTITDDETADAVPGIAVEEVTVREGTSSVAEARLRLSAPSQSDVTVVATTVGGTAEAGRDFEPVTTTVRIPAGRMAAYAHVPIVDDGASEDAETFAIALSQPVNALVETPAAPVKITDDDGGSPPAISVDALAVAEDAAVARFTVTLSAPALVPTLVSYTTADGSALAGEDYAAAGGSIRFAPGDTSKPIDVALINDTGREATETFTLRVEGIEALCTIEDDDGSRTGRSRAVRH